VETPSPLVGLIPTAIQQTARVVEQVELARDTYRLRLDCPDLARQILPGQFFMIKEPDTSDPLLGRPFALYDVVRDESNQPWGIDFGYLVIGKLTRRMTGWTSGDEVTLWGPLGNGFPTPPGGHLVIVAGGIGQTPFLAVTREALGLGRYGDPPRDLVERPDRLTLCYGVRSADYLAGLDDFSVEGLEVRVATDDGSQGHHGLVTEVLEQVLDDSSEPVTIYTCGPEPMMEAVAGIAVSRELACLASLETPMACGFGICFSCVTRVRLADGGWDYRRTCVEGPVFSADRLEW